MKLLKRLYAWLFGYFWLPCPLCGEMFGGFEMVSRPDLSPGWGVCPKHEDRMAVHLWQEKQMQSYVDACMKSGGFKSILLKNIEGEQK